MNWKRKLLWIEETQLDGRLFLSRHEPFAATYFDPPHPVATVLPTWLVEHLEIENAVVVGLFRNPDRRGVGLVLVREDFELVGPGQTIPAIYAPFVAPKPGAGPSGKLTPNANISGGGGGGAGGPRATGVAQAAAGHALK